MAGAGLTRVLRGGGFWAFAASGAGVALGLLREILIVHQIGLGAVNDRLQIYLSVIYGIGLLNEAVRLGAINLLQSRTSRGVVFSVLPSGAVFSVLATGWMYFQLRPDSLLLLAGAAVSGWLNMAMILLVTAKQRGGRFWPAHLINLLPNVLMIPGILVVGWLKPSDPVPALACMFYLLPVVQISLLLMVKTPPVPESQVASASEGGKLFLAHGSSAVGNLLFQGVLRQSGLQTGQGVLALLSISIRMYDSVRFILIDTVIGKKLAAWKEEADLENAMGWIQKLIIPQAILVGIGLVAAFVFGQVEGLRSWTALGVLILSVGSFGLRLVYFMINSQTVSTKMVWAYGIQDVVVALVLAGLTWAGFMWPALLILLWYLAKPLVQLLTVRRSLSAIMAEVGAVPKGGVG